MCSSSSHFVPYSILPKFPLSLSPYSTLYNSHLIFPTLNSCSYLFVPHMIVPHIQYFLIAPRPNFITLVPLFYCIKFQFLLFPKFLFPIIIVLIIAPHHCVQRDRIPILMFDYVSCPTDECYQESISFSLFCATRHPTTRRDAPHSTSMLQFQGWCRKFIRMAY